MADAWLEDRIAYLQGLKSPTEQQKLLMLLAEKTDRSATDERNLKALIRAEKAEERARKAKAEANRILSNEKKAERKARDRELYQSAGLLILAGLVDTKTGKPTVDKAELLGALMSLAEASPSQGRRQDWIEKGRQKLAE